MKMEYTSVKNPKWTSSEKTSIKCIVNFENIGEVPFAAAPDDQYEHTTEIFNRCVAGEFGPIAEYVETETPETPEYDANLYAMFRKNEYPSISEQLDILYHNGFDAWKSEIKKIKDKYPKP